MAFTHHDKIPQALIMRMREDARISTYHDYSRSQSISNSVAQWATKMETVDTCGPRKIRESVAEEVREERMEKLAVLHARRLKLKQLLAQEDKMFEEELNGLGLTRVRDFD